MYTFVAGLMFVILISMFGIVLIITEYNVFQNYNVTTGKVVGYTVISEEQSVNREPHKFYYGYCIDKYEMNNKNKTCQLASNNCEQYNNEQNCLNCVELYCKINTTNTLFVYNDVIMLVMIIEMRKLLV